MNLRSWTDMVSKAPLIVRIKNDLIWYVKITIILSELDDSNKTNFLLQIRWFHWTCCIKKVHGIQKGPDDDEDDTKIGRVANCVFHRSS